MAAYRYDSGAEPIDGVYRIKYEKNGYYRGVDDKGNEIGFFISRNVEVRPTFEVGKRYHISGLWQPDGKDIWYYTSKSESKYHHTDRLKQQYNKRDARRIEATQPRKCFYGYNVCRNCEMECYGVRDEQALLSDSLYGTEQPKEVILVDRF